MKIKEKGLDIHKMTRRKAGKKSTINMCIAMEFLYLMRCTFLLSDLSETTLLEHSGG